MTFISRTTTNVVLEVVVDEMLRSNAARPNYPTDPLRRAALVNEEAGESIQAALDLTRSNVKLSDIAMLRGRLRTELTHTAAMAVRALIEMAEEDKNSGSDLPTD